MLFSGIHNSLPDKLVHRRLTKYLLPNIDAWKAPKKDKNLLFVGPSGSSEASSFAPFQGEYSIHFY